MSGLNRKLERTNTICPPPETVLLESVRRNNLQAIRNLIESNSSLLDHEYPSTRTILPTACSEEGISPTAVQTLIDLGADINGTAEWKPLHLAAENPNSEILEVIIKNLKPGQINDTVDGNTALHSLVKSEDVEKNEEELTGNIVKLLKSGINVNLGDDKNVSAILYAAKHGRKMFVTAILDNSVGHVDVDSHNVRGKTARQLIKDKHLYDKPLPERVQHQNPKELSFALLKQSKEEQFITYFDTLALTNPRDFVNCDDNTSTLLQYACDKGLSNVVEYLVNNGANVNLTTKNNQKTPIELTAEHGYFEIFAVLLDHRAYIDSKTLCYLLKKFDAAKSYKTDHERCCQIMLQRLELLNTVDINGEDSLKNTPLHYAVRYADGTTTATLLTQKASLACKNNFGSTPVEDITPHVLEAHLDKCIKFDINNKNDEKRDFEVTLDYENLVPPRKMQCCKFDDATIEELVAETEVIAYMSKAPEFKHLLKHPVIVSFLYMKWHRIRLLFYTNLLFYMFFVLSLIVYIFTCYVHNEQKVVWSDLVRASFVTLNLTFVVMILRELFQITVSPTTYIKNFENLVELVLIVVTGMILYISTPGDDTRKQLSAIAILLAAFELVLMVGQHPKLSTNVVMFKTVSVNFFQLLSWYSLLIIAFALSFFILFSKSEVSDNVNITQAVEDEDSFKGPGKSLFKTIIMLTGEFDAGSIDFQSYPIISKLIFSLFVFMITIILLNLLNGLAVSDTQAIKNNAELVSHITRAQYIYYVECMLLGNVFPTSLIKIFQVLFCCFPCNRGSTATFFKPLARKVCVFTNPRCCQLLVLPNDHGKICYEDGVMTKARRTSLCATSCTNIHVDKETIKRINAVVKNRRQAEENQTHADGLYGEIQALKTKLEQVLSTLSRSNVQL